MLKEVLKRMEEYIENYSSLRYNDEINLQFDIDKKWLEENEPNHPILKKKPNEDLDTRREKTKHIIPMNGLAKDFSLIEIQKWIDKAWTQEVHLWYKFDGAACSILFWKDKKFLRATTRWNGSEWDDIKENFKMLKNFSDFEELKYIDDKIISQIDFIELRWEIMVQKSEFEKNNFWITNTRQYASWWIKLKDPNEVKKRNLIFLPYTMYFIKDNKRVLIESEDLFNSQKWFSEYLRILWIENERYIWNGFGCEYLLNKNILQSEEFIMSFYHNRNKLDVDIDGLVFKVNSYEEQMKLDTFAMAYKFPNEKSLTQIENIEFWVGRSWRVTPLAVFKPINILWVTCSKASLHNMEYVEKFNFSVWDTISVVRSWDVIPQVVDLVEKSENWEKIKISNCCPSCWNELKRKWPFLFCENTFECPKQKTFKLLEFSEIIWINFIWEKIAETLSKNLKNHFEILHIIYEELISYWVAKKVSEKIIYSKEQAIKSLNFEKILSGLFVENLSLKNAEKISEKFTGVEEAPIKHLKENLEKILEIDGIWESIYGNLKSFFENNSDFIIEIEKLIEEFNISFPKKKEWWKLDWKKFYITGKLEMKRDDVKKLIKELWWVEWTLKNCDFFIAWNNATEWKVEEAKNIGKTILNEEEFKNLL